MEIIPAIDLKGGACVRLRQGREDAAREYSTDPVTVAREWASQGARRLHVVNLDGAFGRESDNLEVLRGIAAVKDISVQYGGGLRTREAIESAFAAGAARVVLGTVAVLGAGLLEETILRYGAERVIVALDTVGGKLAVKGWTEVTDRPVRAVAVMLKKSGVREILHTDILRDGMLTGPDLKTLTELAETGLSIIASGGISSVDDIRTLRALGRPNITGAIVGRALYEGIVGLPALIAATVHE
jgi:phosphoribosylformimino-5-aminoimidazole carboxamide ribotide isomerase